MLDAFWQDPNVLELIEARLTRECPELSPTDPNETDFIQEQPWIAF